MKAKLVTIVAVALVLTACAKKQKAVMLEDTLSEQTVATNDGSTSKSTATDGQESTDRAPIFFDFNSSELSESSRARLNKLAMSMKEDETAVLTVEGNTDSRGSTEFNLALGERRARAARDYLTRLGVDSKRVQLVSYGEERPVDSTESDAAHARNRRDEFRISQ